MMISYGFLGLVLVAVAVYFATGRKWIVPVYGMLVAFCGFVYAHLADIYKADKILLLLVLLILAPVIVYDALRRSTDPGRTYLGFCIASSVFVLPIIVITTIRNEFEFQPDSLWLGLIPVVALSIRLLLKSNEAERRSVFLITGIALILIYIAILFFHPYMYTRILHVKFLPISIRLNGVYFIYLLMFVLTGFHRLGLLPERFNHTKLMMPVVILGILSYGTRLPAVSKTLAASPVTEHIPLILASLVILLIPLVAAYVLLFCRRSPGNRDRE